MLTCDPKPVAADPGTLRPLRMQRKRKEKVGAQEVKKGKDKETGEGSKREREKKIGSIYFNYWGTD